MKRIQKPLLVTLAALALFFIVLLILQETHTTHFFESAKEKQKQQQTNYDNSKKKAAVENNGNPSSDGNASNPGTSSTYTPPSSSNNITITASQPNTNQVVVTTRLAGYSDGTCTLSVANGGKSTSQTAEVIYQQQFSTCAGFTIPVSPLGVGTWNINLSVVSSGITTSKASTFEVK